MTKAEALYSLWKSVGMGEAYAEDSVPDDAVMPYITYPLTTDSFGNEIAYTITIWNKSNKWQTLNDIVEQFDELFNNGSFVWVFDDGSNQKLLIRKGSPFAQSMTDPDDNTVKRKVLNFIIEFLTTY